METNWDIASAIGAVITAIMATIAFFTYRSSLKKQEEERIRDSDKELIHQIQISFEWAYAALVGIDGQSHFKPNRLNWLTCARHLLRQEEITKEIVGVVYKTIYEETKEYWRHQFYLAIENAIKSGAYFAANPNDKTLSIEPVSAFVIINFSIWPDDKDDPTNRLTPESIVEKLDSIEDHFSTSSMKHYEQYLKTLPEYKEFFNSEIDDDSKNSAH